MSVLEPPSGKPCLPKKSKPKPKTARPTFHKSANKPKLAKKESQEGFNSIMNAKFYHPMRELSSPRELPPGFAEAIRSEYGAGGIGTDFPQGDIGQPFWFSNIGGNHFPREGFTYRPYDLPIVPFKDQLKGYLDDEDARMGIDFLAAKTTGGAHYFKAKTRQLSKYMTTWTDKVNLDLINWQVAKELLAFGNSFWRLRKPIWQCTSEKDFQQIPIESAARIWWTPDRRPLWYEFRGAEYNGYFRPEEIIHFKWNPTNGQVFGFGIMAQLTNRVEYLEDTPDGPIIKEREAYLDIKHGLQNVSYKVMKRYLPRYLFHAPKAGEDVRDAMRSELRILHDSEDIVSGVPGMNVDQLGAQTKPIDPQLFMDMFQSSIFKAVQTSKGRIAGQSQGPTYANGEESAILDEIGMSQFPIQLKRMVQDAFAKPWYEMNRIQDKKLTGGLDIAIPWDAADFEMMFGKQTKKDLEPEQVAQWVQMLQAGGQISPFEIRKIAEYVGVPELISDDEGGMNAEENLLSTEDTGTGIGMLNTKMAMEKKPMESGQKVPGSPNKSKHSRA